MGIRAIRKGPEDMKTAAEKTFEGLLKLAQTKKGLRGEQVRMGTTEGGWKAAKELHAGFVYAGTVVRSDFPAEERECVQLWRDQEWHYRLRLLCSSTRTYSWDPTAEDIDRVLGLDPDELAIACLGEKEERCGRKT